MANASLRFDKAQRDSAGVFLAMRAGRFITGQTLVIDGRLTVNSGM